MVTRAVASETPATTTPPRTFAMEAGQTGADLVARLGSSRTAGTWIGADGKPVVAVTDEKAAAEVRGAGAVAKVVEHSMDDLKSAAKTLRSAPRVAGTAWSMDYRTNEVVVQGDSTVSASDWSAMKKVANGIGGFVKTERAEERSRPG